MAIEDYAPAGHAGGTPPARGAITEAMLEALRGTKGWVRLIGILALVGSAFTVVAAIVMTVRLGTMGPPQGALPGGLLALVCVGYVLTAVVYVFLGLYLIRYSAAIGRLLRDGQAEAMEAALQYQRKFWRLAGIIALVMLTLVALGIVAAMAVALFVGR